MIARYSLVGNEFLVPWLTQKDSEDLSAEDLARISGGFYAGNACLRVADGKLS